MMRSLLGLILLAQAAPAQSEADKLEAALKKFGERTYTITERGNESGTMTLKSRIDKEGDRKIVVFEDRIALKVPDMEATMSLTEKASPDGLRLISATRTGTGPDGKFEWGISVREGKVTIKMDDRTQTVDATQATTGEQAVLRLVCATEQKVGASFKADVVTLVAERLDPDHAFQCVGKESIDIGGRKFETFKWEQKGEWKITRKIGDREVPGTARVNNVYWVSPDGYLVRFTQGSTEMTLESK